MRVGDRAGVVVVSGVRPEAEPIIAGMAENPTPLDGQIWKAPSGRPALYVRTEAAQDGTQRHLFVSAHDRLVLTFTVPDGVMPDGYELVTDGHGAERAKADREQLQYERIQHGLEMAELRAENEALVTAMKRAVAVVSPEAGADLRRVFRQARGEALTR